MELAGRVALVTGGSGDLGSGICRALARHQMNVAVTYVAEKERAERTVSEVEAAGCRGWAIHLDQSSATMPDEVVAATTAHFGRLDVLDTSVLRKTSLSPALNRSLLRKARGIQARTR